MAEMMAATMEKIEIGSIFVHERLKSLDLKLESMIVVHEPLRTNLGQTNVQLLHSKREALCFEV